MLMTAECIIAVAVVLSQERITKWLNRMEICQAKTEWQRSVGDEASYRGYFTS
jgi:hypothetical protein